MSINISKLALLVGILVACLGWGGEFPPTASTADVPRLLKRTEHIRGLSEAEMIELVPRQSGFRYVDCPNCSGGRQENQLTWTPDLGDQVICSYCDHRYPSDKYPMSNVQVVINPRGESVSFPYWADSQGQRHFFMARRDYEVREYLAIGARDLAILFAITGDETYSRRAALILDRFAELFPGWCYHYDYPFRPKEIFEGNVPPSEFLPGFRTARWSCWAYGDIPVALVQAYDWIRDSSSLRELSGERGLNVSARIENDLLRNAAEQVLANQDALTNMSPVAWTALAITGRVLKEPRYVHEVVDRCRRLVLSKFFYDGSWYEGAPSYAAATLDKLAQLVNVLQGTSDPVGYVDASDGTRFDNFQATQWLPSLEEAQASLRTLRLPDGRLVPMHDTWSTKTLLPPAETTLPYLLPALGHACLGGGTAAEQTQFHLTWSGGYGHSHADNLSLMMFAGQRELLSDLGYTHTAYRSWTLASAAHNTVLIDGQNQSFGSLASPSDGRLLRYDVSDPKVQVVRADGRRGYPGLADVYERTVVVVNAPNEAPYAVDLFDVVGGSRHDYFLHGDADDAFQLKMQLELSPLASLLPPGFDWRATQDEGEAHRVAEPYYAYGFFRNLQFSKLESNRPIPLTWIRSTDRLPYLRTWLIPQSNSELVVGENPSIRQAEEDDARLGDFNRPFVLVRNEAIDSRSRFVSVLEPFRDEFFVSVVEPIEGNSEAVVLQVQRGRQSDWIVLDASKPVSFLVGSKQATFQGEVGVMTLQDDAIVHSYALGNGGWSRDSFQLNSTGTVSARLVAVDDRMLTLDYPQGPLPETGSTLRILTADDFTYPCTIAKSERIGGQLQVHVAENLSMQYDSGQKHLRLASFPQREHTGSLVCEWESP